MIGGDKEDETISPEEKSERISELIDAVPPQAEEEATELVRETDDVDTVIEGLEQIISGYHPDTSDEAVKHAETLASLERMMESNGTIISWIRMRIGSIIGSERVQLKKTIKQVSDSVESEADQIIEQGDSAEEVITALEFLTEDFHKQRYNNIVSEADSLSDLKHSFTENGDEENGDLFDTVRQKTDEGIEETQQTLKNAEPEHVAMWGLGLGLASINPMIGAPAVAAATSTPAVVGAAALGGGAIGAYASTHEESSLNDINPLETFIRTHQMAKKGSEMNEIEGEKLGAALMASSQLAEVVASEAYAHWITQADPEAVLEGANLGAHYAQQRDLGMSRTEGKAVGAGLGLLYGYADTDNRLQQTLDSDLFQEYKGQLEQ